MSEKSTSNSDEVPLCVDLDGTLVNTDTLFESALKLIKANPFSLVTMLLWLLSGKANLKEKIATRISLDVAILPYNQPLLEWLQMQCDGGRQLVLVTAANIRIAQAISEHLKIFSQVLASDSTRNLSASAKREELDRQFGPSRYDYVGNSRDDLQVWSGCRRAVLVNASKAVSVQAAGIAEVEATFPQTHNPLRELLTGMRPYQWSKNLLVFVSIFVAHEYNDTQLLFSTCIAFVSFCLCSSSVYLINDLLDLETDRKHSKKCSRPFASGRAPVLLGILAAPVLLLLSATLAWLAGTLFFNVLVLYFVVTLGYSFYLKRLALLDVLILAGLYTLRLIAGASVAEQVPSVWLVSFSMFIFTSLAMAKRYSELKSMPEDADAWVGGRGYHVGDIAIIAQLGAASGYISTLVLALYIDSSDVAEIYSHHELMWLLCPLMMYWIGRIWLVASRGELQQDPVVYATRDGPSYVVFLLGLATIMAAT